MNDRTAAKAPQPPPSPPGTPAARRPPGRVPGWTVWTLRVTAIIVAVLVLTQPVLAGLFVTGDVGKLKAHSATAGFVTVLAFFQLIAAILLWRPGRGPAWPIWAALAFFLAAEVQGGLGYARAVSLHIPMGVLLFGSAVVMVIATWKPSLRVRRSRPRRDTGEPPARGTVNDPMSTP